MTSKAPIVRRNFPVCVSFPMQVPRATNLSLEDVEDSVFLKPEAMWLVWPVNQELYVLRMDRQQVRVMRPLGHKV